MSCNDFRLKRPGQRKKYGLLSNYDDSVEMDAVESDEDDTLYEARSLRRSEVNMFFRVIITARLSFFIFLKRHSEFSPHKGAANS